MTNYQIATRFVRLADILEIQGEDPFKVRAYRKAAEEIETLDEPLSEIAERGELETIPGFGKAIIGKVQDLLTKGTFKLWDEVKDAVPLGVVQIASIRGIGPKTVKALWDALGVTSVDDLEKAAQDGKVRGVAGFGPAKEKAMLESIAQWRHMTEKTPLYVALPFAEALVKVLRTRPEVTRAEITGEVASRRDEVTGVDLILESNDLPATQTFLLQMVHDTPCEVRVVQDDPSLAFIEPELRDWPDIRELAEAGKLPKLVTEADFMGQLHEHTTWSDGTASIREMVEAALARGYAYLAITDHSPLVQVANGLGRDRLLAQMKEIDALNEEYAGRITILKGQEVDICADGSLDMDEDVLAQLDIVVASAHMRYKEDEAKMTARLIKAIENSHVDIIGHPTGRLVGRRPPYPIDMDAVIAAAVRTGTVLEINASSDRMDLKDEYARRAVAAGAKISINADAHSIAGLGQLRWGLYMARRAGLTAEDVINTYPLERLRATLKDGRK